MSVTFERVFQKENRSPFVHSYQRRSSTCNPLVAFLPKRKQIESDGNEPALNLNAGVWFESNAVNVVIVCDGGNSPNDQR